MIVNCGETLNRSVFPKSNRLIRNSQFRAVLARGLSAHDGLLKLYVCENGLDYSRLGISIGKYYGTAVARNRLKRLLREVFRQNRHLLTGGFDYVVSMSSRWVRQKREGRAAKTNVSRPGYEQVRDSLLTLAARLADERS